MILSSAGSWYIDPFSRHDTLHYISYYGRDLPSLQLDDQHRHLTAAGAIRPQPPSGAVLRTYRLAMAVTSQYTAFHGGTQQGAMNAIVTMVNRLDEIFEREVAVRMTLITNETAIIYLPGSADPYTNGDSSAMMEQNRTNLETVIGPTNYDVGHVLGTQGGGGVAYVGVVCNAMYKAGGASISNEPAGEGFARLIAHEIGHQFGAQHVYNAVDAGCNANGRNQPSAVEPGSGSTLMAYAGSCGDSNLQNDDDSYFNSLSFDQIVAYTAGEGSCAVQTMTGNNPPVVNAGQNYTIPNNTPFQLTGAATDPNGDALTYVWEEQDSGAASPPNNDDGTRALFRSILPGSSPTRLFPQLANVLANNTTALGDTLPTTNRTLNFRLVARDNRAGGGGVDYAAMTVSAVTAADPFRVTAPGADTWAIGSMQTVRWDVANTTQAPVSCAQVNILLSTDNGQTFPVTLAANAANTGSQTVTVPNNLTSQGRVRVACAGNIFFDISHANLTIATVGNPPAGGASPTVTATPATATPSVMPTVTATPCAITFSDVPPTAYFYPYVQYLYCHADITGYADNTFRPANTATRAQLVKIITLTFDLGAEPPAAGTYSFADVLPSDPFFHYIEAAAAAQVVNGYTCGGLGEPCDSQNRRYFRPGAAITRGQLAKIIVTAQAWPLLTHLGQVFADVPAGDPFNGYIDTLSCHYVISGYTCGGPGEPCDSQNRRYFRPSTYTNRGQIAKIVFLADEDLEPCITP